MSNSNLLIPTSEEDGSGLDESSSDGSDGVCSDSDSDGGVRSAGKRAFG